MTDALKTERRGGARRGTGPKPIGDVRIHATLRQADRDYLLQIGGGNMSMSKCLAEAVRQLRIAQEPDKQRQQPSL